MAKINVASGICISCGMRAGIPSVVPGSPFFPSQCTSGWKKKRLNPEMCGVYKIPVLGRSMQVEGGDRREAFFKDINETVLLDDLSLCAYPYSDGLVCSLGYKRATYELCKVG